MMRATRSTVRISDRALHGVAGNVPAPENATLSERVPAERGSFGIAAARIGAR